MGAMRDRVEATPNRRHLPDARKEAGLNFLFFFRRRKNVGTTAQISGA